MSDIEDMDLDNGVSSQDDAGAPTGAEQPAPASSSSATDVSNSEPEGALDIVRDVVDKRQPEPAASSASSEGGEAAGDPPKTQDDENYSDVPFNKHPRFQQVLGKLKTAEVDAGRYRNVQAFLDQNGLDGEEAADLLMIGGLMKTNPAEAWRRMAPTVKKILEAAGEVLPDDLAQRVQNGEMSRETALEISRSKANVRSIEGHRSFEQQQAARRQQQERVSAIQGEVASWEADRQAKDPNFAAKVPALQREVAFLQSQEGKPDTAEGVRAQLEKAYRAVNDAIPPAAPVQPVRAPITPIRGGQTPKNPATPPKNTLDIIQNVVARRGT